MPRPYHIEKGRKPPVKKRSDEEFDRAVEELQSLVHENKKLLSDYPLTMEDMKKYQPIFILFYGFIKTLIVMGWNGELK